VDSLPEAIHIANQVDPTPLSLYSFGSKAENEKGKIIHENGRGRESF
jgi:hypothetical protein